MSGKEIEFFWDAVSPYTYLASTRIEQVARECGASVRWRPFLLGGVFRDTGNKPPLDVKHKGAYMIQDLTAWAAYYKVPFTFPASFPANSLLAMRAATAADRLDRGPEFARALMNAYWVEGKDISEEGNVRDVAGSLGLDVEAILRQTRDPEIKEALKQNTAEAVKRGAFGAPTFFVGEKMFWGNDRFTIMEAYLKGEL